MILHISAIIILLSTGSLGVDAAGDILAPGESISENQTIVSAGSIFTFGFFSPGKSTRRYVGIWYNKIPEKTVVWVANRDKPLTASSGVVKIGSDGNIVLLHSEGNSTIWSSNVSAIQNKTVAVLFDSGNLVLREADGTQIWQSFDHPTDTYMPGMKLWTNYITHTSERITAWKNSEDPSPGNYSFGFDPETSLQLKLWNGPVPYWRSGLWNEKGLAALYTTNSTLDVVLKFSATETEILMIYSLVEGSSLARYVLEPTGEFFMLIWNDQSKRWVQPNPSQNNPCAGYNYCGPYGTCSGNGTYPLCKCLPGFVPRFQKDWDFGKFLGGCTRKMPIRCDKDEIKFSRVEKMKLPDQMMQIMNTSETKCQSECTSRCNCSAYSYAKITGAGSSSTCIIWVGDLIDLEQEVNSGNNLNLRVHASELASGTQIDVSSKKKHLLLIIVPVLVIVILLVGVFSYLLMRRVKQHGTLKHKAASHSQLRAADMLENKKGTIRLPFVDFTSILAATDSFALANKLGEGGFGPVFKGRLHPGQEIAVKRLSKNSTQGSEEFKNEVELIAGLQHKNLVKILGWCIHGEERILIYEYLPNKSLDKYIFDPKQSAKLDYKKRLRIIDGIAQGILYLHRYSRFRVIHRDLKASNILLDEAMNPKISDFGLARIFEENQTEANTKKVVGTYGYMSPEYALNGLYSEKSDVFSFGVILLEITTGKRCTGFYPYRTSLNLLEYVWQLWDEGRCSELAYSSMNCSFPAPEVSKCIQIGLLCVQERTDDRPAMVSVVSMLSIENAVLPSPKQPAFAIGRDAKPATELSSFSKQMESVNQLTSTTTEGR